MKSRDEKAFMVSVVSLQRGGGGHVQKKMGRDLGGHSHIAAETLEKNIITEGKVKFGEKKEAW